MRIVVSADGAREGRAARRWCHEHAAPGDDIVAVVGTDQWTEALLSVSPLMEMVDERRIRERTEARFARAGLAARVAVRAKPQHRAVLDVAAEERADLIVVGKRSHGAFVDGLLNETAAHLVHRPPCPVLVVPAGDAHLPN